MRYVWPRFLALGFAAAALAANGCTSRTDPRLVELERSIRAEQRRLDDIARQVKEAEERAKAARSEAEYQSCRASAGELRAEVARRQAMCAKDVADHNLCMALNSKQRAENTLSGCAIGLLLGGLSGGLAAPWALGGCAVGADSTPAPDCPIACTDKLPELQTELLAERSLDAFPLCGGYFGLSIQPLLAKIENAIWIERVAPGTTAQSASMAKGDALWMVAGTRVSSAADVELALASIEPGQMVALQVIRQNQQLSLTGTASRRSATGELGERVVLGVLFGDSLTQVPFEAAVEVADVDQQAPAHGVLRVHDAITAVSVESPATELQPARTPEALGELLENVRAGQTVTFEVIRGENEVRVEVRAAERGTHRWL